MAFNVVILANSFPLKIRPTPRSPQDGTYARWLERLLEERYPDERVRVHNFGRFLGMLHHGIAAFDQAVSAIGPDVVIVNYGGNECFPRYLPMWLIEFMTRFRLSSNWFAYNMFRMTDVGQVLLMRPFISFFRPSGWYSLKKYRRLLTKLIRMTIQESRARVIVFNLPDVSDRVEYLIPGCRRRIVLFNEAIAEIAKEHGATLIDLYRWIGRDFKGKLPDSFHMSAETHRNLAAWLLREIVRIREEQSAGAQAATPWIKPRGASIPAKIGTKEVLSALVRKIGSSLWQKTNGRQDGENDAAGSV